MSTLVSNFSNINNKISKLFNNPNINFFIIMMLILIISCYTLINTSLKYAISSFVSNPIIILFSLITVILISYYNINIAILVLLLLFIVLYGSTIFNSKSISNNSLNINNKTEGFTDDTDNNNESDNSEADDEFDEENNEEDGDQKDDDEDDEEEDTKKKSYSKEKEEEAVKTDETVNKIKNTILGTINNFKDVSNNEYKKSLLENKQIIYQNEKKNNKNKNNNNKQNFTNTNSKSNSNSNSKKNSRKENFHTIKPRKFDPNKEEDTNLLISKEILEDTINRIDYNYESNKYLKKYLKHRIEEIVDINKLLEDDDN